MTQTINRTEEVVEIPIAEYEAIKAVAAGIADQNALVLDAIKGMAESVVSVSDVLARILETAFAPSQVIVNVPEQPAPVVNVTNTMPEQPAAQVTMKMPPEKEKKIVMKVKRDRNGAVEGIEGTEKSA